MKSKLLILALFILLTNDAISQSTVDVEYSCFRYECRCFRCDKNDIYYYPIPNKLRKNSKTPSPEPKILTSQYRKYDANNLFSLIIEEAEKLSYQNYNKVSIREQDYWKWLAVCDLFPAPDIVPANGCSQNYGGKHDLKYTGPEIESIVFHLSKSDVDHRLEAAKAEIQRAEEEQKQNEERKVKMKKIESELRDVFYNKILWGYKKAVEHDSIGIDTIGIALTRISRMFGDKINFEFVMNIDSFNFNFYELCDLYALSHLYAGAYQRGIKNISKLINTNKLLDNDDYNIYLGMAYLMNCQALKASGIFVNTKLNSSKPCSIYDKVDKLIDDMRKSHPDLKCIKTLKTISIMALLMCQK